MSTTIVNASRIQNITPEGLTYIDDDGAMQFIDFAACYERYWEAFIEPNHLQQFKETNHMSDEKLQASIERRKNWKEVAQRNIIGNPPYIEFHTIPKIRFDFADDDAFRSTRYEIEKHGWKTFDLS